MQEPIKLEENWRNPDGTLKPGHPNLGAGRPKGKTLKEFAREYLMGLPDEEKLDYLKKLPQDIVWKMAEGMPKQDTDLTSNGKTINVLIPQAVADSFNINETNQETGRSNQE